MAKISYVEQGYLRFDNGYSISSDHEADCCEYNYADFPAIDDEALSYDFDLSKLLFEETEYGFRFGDNPLRMFFVPCYSEQNGWYSTDVDIYFNTDRVILGLECEMNGC